MPKKGIPSICEFKSGRQVCTHIPLDPSPGLFIVGRILKLVAALNRKCRNADTCNGVYIPWRKRIPRCCGRRQSSLILMTRSCERRKHVVVGAGTRYGRFDWIILSVFVAVGMSCPGAGVAELGHNCSGGRAGRHEPAFLHPVHVVRICLRHVDLRGFCAARRDELILFRPL